MSESLPMAIEAEIPLSQQEIEVLHQQYISEGDKVRPQTKFNYAWALVRSKSKSDQLRGVSLLADIYRETPSRRRECLYYLALGEYKLGNYRNARKYNDNLLNLEPKNSQALALRQTIDERVRKDGIVGVAIVGGVVALIGALTLSLLKPHK
ncbi:uncharacterized protein BJ171DRAFT_519577 [Polychytrium aggregatum]|uniref:uncharacterized protein n=1 Tax=Polychytrium aggregatum TaxID=110093 RepID=UPI0022FE01E8|nr:uncharacterized protein BJ171DRAFT_519577 [Polychytrium aggregatum]KAI9197454.1 hypothetical protein BJ171DRAFT_519577 [Polychytrium aggregatum]